MKIILALLFSCGVCNAQVYSPISLGQVVKKKGDTMTGQLTTTSTITVRGSAFSVGGSTLVVVNGRVGIGVLSPTQKLDIGGNIYFPQSSSISSLGTLNLLAGSGAQLRISILGATGWLGITSGNTGEEWARFTNTGLFGIGNTAPTTKLHLSSGTITLDGTGSPAKGGALCLTAAGVMGRCTSAVDASGNCTCL